MTYTPEQLKALVRTIARQLQDTDIKDTVKRLDASFMNITLGDLIDVITLKTAPK